jgi:hypothetical protein
MRDGLMVANLVLSPGLYLIRHSELLDRDFIPLPVTA